MNNLWKIGNYVDKRKKKKRWLREKLIGASREKKEV